MSECLEQAFQFALQENTFNKADIARRAKNVCIYGLGKYFEDAFLRQSIGERFGVTHLCDGSSGRRHEVRRDKRYRKFSCIAPEEIKDLEDAVVVFMLGDPREAMTSIRKQVPREQWYRLIAYNDLILDDIMQISDKSRLEGDIGEVYSAYDLLEDERSREVFHDVLCLRIAPQYAMRNYEDLCTLPQYFPADIIELGRQESIVDCGAFTGDTLQEFAVLTGNSFERYDAFEIDRENYSRLQETAKKIDAARVFCHPYGVWDETKDLSYGRMSSADSYSVFNGNEVSGAHVVKLDEFIPSTQTVTFIKMDIEGAEMRALHGCQEIIRAQKPTLAICVYHRMEDLWKIPLWIKGTCADYAIYIRHHANFWVSETVCYGVYKERGRI